MECQTGKIRWTERLDGGESWGSVVMAAGRLYVTSRRGVTTVFRPDPEKFELLAMNDLGEPSNATPAISDGQIFSAPTGTSTASRRIKRFEKNMIEHELQKSTEEHTRPAC
jgi:outer membrane protein assembly factor BamB